MTVSKKVRTMSCCSTSFIKFAAWSQVILAVFLAAAAIYLYLLNRQATKSDVFKSSSALLNHYAGVLTTQRKVYEGFYEVLPPLRDNIQSIGAFSADIDRLADNLLAISKLHVPLVDLTPFASLAPSALRLKELAEDNLATMAAADKALSAFDVNAHQQVLDAIDNTILELKQNAIRLEERGRQVLVTMRTLLFISLVMSLLFFLNGIGNIMLSNVLVISKASCTGNVEAATPSEP